MEASPVQSIWIEAEVWVPGTWDSTDTNTGVIVTRTDGSRWVASFFTYANIAALTEKNRRTGENLSGNYFWASDMILIQEVTRQAIEEVIEDLMEDLIFERVFSRIENEDNETKHEV